MKTTIDTLTHLQAELSQTSAQINAINRYNSNLIYCLNTAQKHNFNIAHLAPQLEQLQSTVSAFSVLNPTNLQIQNQVKNAKLSVDSLQQSTISAIESVNKQYLYVYQEFVTQFVQNFTPLRQSLLDLSKLSVINSQIDLGSIMKDISIEGDYVYIQDSTIEHLSLTINLPPAPDSLSEGSKRKLSIYDFIKDILMPLLTIIISLFSPSQELPESLLNRIDEEIVSLEETIDYHNQILEELVQSLESLLEDQDKNAGCDCTQHCNDASKKTHKNIE